MLRWLEDWYSINDPVWHSVVLPALLSTSLISLAPNVILLAFPSIRSAQEPQNQQEQQLTSPVSRFLSLGQAVAAGGLLGDVFLHTLPHASAFAGHGHSAKKDDDPGLWLLLGFTIFFATDLLIRSMHPHSHSSSSSSSDDKQSHGHSHHHHSVITQQGLSSLVVLNLVADALHNFTDGLAIGVTYAASASTTTTSTSTTTWTDSLYAASSLRELLLVVVKNRGVMASLSVLFHEIPHELGDYCSLLRGGFTKTQAILTQFCTAIAAFCGTLVAIRISTSNQHDKMGDGPGANHLLWITAGGFVYLSATTILPEVLNDGTTVRFRLAQFVAFGCGIAFLYAVSLLEEHDHEHHHDHHHHHHEEHDQTLQHDHQNHDHAAHHGEL